MKNTMKKVMLTAMTLGLFAPGAPVRAENMGSPVSPAGGQSTEKHPRRHEVNDRVRNQRRLLRQQLKEGKITRQQFHDQMGVLNNVKNQEHADVKANGGYVTKQQQGAMNQELNQNREQIKDNIQGAGAPDNTAPAGQK